MGNCAHGARADNEQAILSALALRVGPQRFNAWFRNTTRFHVEDNHVGMSVPNAFVGTWIESHFMSDIEDSVQEAMQQPLPLMISVDPALSSHFRKKQLDTQASQVSRSTSGEARGGNHAPAQSLRHRLEDFMVGPSNQLAYSTAVAAAAGDSASFNPLFIHGGCGLGKTHLLQGLCNLASQRRSGRATRWRYVSGEQFTNEFVSAIKRKELESFRATYRKLDLLVIDDVHFLAAKKATQEEFLHTFDQICSGQGKQIVMASDAHPKLVGQFTDQLISRFVSGMVVKIEPPDQELRLKILRRRAALQKVSIPEDVLGYIAMHIRGSVRELEGTLIKLTALAGLSQQPITLEMASSALADHLAQTDSALTLGDIEAIVAAYFGVTPADIHSSRRTRTVSLARMVAMTLARRHTPMSFPEIARSMGKNHSSAVLAVQRMEKMLSADESMEWMTPAGPRSAKAGALLSTLQGQLP